MKYFNNSALVFMSPNNGQLVVGIPLYTRHSDETDKHKFIIQIESDKPVAYAVECGPEIGSMQFLNAEWTEENLECLGAL